VKTPFPAGLEPFEDNEVPDTDDRSEVLRAMGVPGGADRAHGRGYIHVSRDALWEVAKASPEGMVARCSTTTQTITRDWEPRYEASFRVNYFVDDILDVRWDDDWRYGSVELEVGAPLLGMIRHQKTEGSDFISVSEGSVQIIATDDPDVTEVAFVEHLDAVSGDAEDLIAGMNANYDALRELAHGRPIPPCP